VITSILNKEIKAVVYCG